MILEELTWTRTPTTTASTPCCPGVAVPRPPARAGDGRRAVDHRRHRRRATCGSSSSAGTGPPTWWWRRPARSTTRRSSPRSHAALHGARGRRAARARRPSSDGVEPRVVQRRSHRAGPPGHRVPGRARAATRPRGVARRGQPRPRGRHVEPPVRRDPRAARPGLRGVLVAGVVLRHRRAHDLRRHGAGPGRRGARPRRPGARAAGRRGPDRRRAGGGQGLPRRLVRARPGGPGQPHGPPRRPAHLPRAAPDRRRDGRGVPGRRRAPPSPR